jgi:hypothetical protein
MVRRTLLGCLLAFCCVTLTGCGDSHESVMKEALGMMNNMVTDMEGGMAPDKLKEKYDAQGKALKARMDKIGKPSAAEEKRLKEKFEPEFAKLMPRMMQAAMKSGGAGMPKLDFGL